MAPAQAARLIPALTPAQPVLRVVHVIGQHPAADCHAHQGSAGDGLLAVPLPRCLPLRQAHPRSHRRPPYRLIKSALDIASAVAWFSPRLTA